jgi:CubicO group peptidase (beta-lactamase class C family)
MSRLRGRSPFVPLVGLLLVLARPSPICAQQPPAEYEDVSLPAGARGLRLQALVEAVNTGDPARIEAFVEHAFAPAFLAAVPLSEHVAVALSFYDGSHGFDVHGVRRYTPPREDGAEILIVRNRLTGAWQAFSLHLEEAAPHRIAGLDFLPARPPKDLPAPGPLDLEAAVSELRAFVERLAQAAVFSGSVLLAKDGQLLYSDAHGLADRNHAVPNVIDTKFNLGSMNKMFTAVTAAQLVEEGKLRFDDPVSSFLGGKGWTSADLSKVRVEHLLTHTSGLGSYFNQTYQRSARQLFRKLDDYKPLLAEETLAFEPGTRWSYSNSGMLLAGAVIEAASGEDYFDRVRRTIYGPAGMSASDCYDIDYVVPKLAIGYELERGPQGARWHTNTFSHVIRGGPAGGGYSTAPDLLAFAEALRGGRLLKPETFEKLVSAKPELNSPDYGYGFGVAQGPNGRIVGHSGGFEGINSNLDIFLDRGIVAVVMSNQSNGAMPVVQKIRELLARVPAR